MQNTHNLDVWNKIGWPINDLLKDIENTSANQAPLCGEIWFNPNPMVQPVYKVVRECYRLDGSNQSAKPLYLIFRHFLCSVSENYGFQWNSSIHIGETQSLEEAIIIYKQLKNKGDKSTIPNNYRFYYNYWLCEKNKNQIIPKLLCESPCYELLEMYCD